MSEQVIVVNYEDRSTTMEAPDDEDRSLKCARRPSLRCVPSVNVASSAGPGWTAEAASALAASVAYRHASHRSEWLRSTPCQLFGILQS